MKTNREKYEHYCAIIEASDAAAVKVLLPDGVPAQFFEIDQYEAKPRTVTKVERSHSQRFYRKGADSKILKADVEQAQMIAETWEFPTLDDVYVYYTYQQTYGVVSAARPYPKIGADAGQAWDAASLAPEIERRRALYAPRDGHTGCGYCRKQHPTASLVGRTIYYRDQGATRTKTGQYCCEQCGYYDQCGHEG